MVGKPCRRRDHARSLYLRRTHTSQSLCSYRNRPQHCDRCAVRCSGGGIAGRHRTKPARHQFDCGITGGMTVKAARYIGVALLVWGLASATVLAPVASATWGKKCSAGETHHCYALSIWEMTGSGNGGGEEVMGESSEFYTVSMLVPYWEDHDFVTNEQWMSNPAGGWAEDGQLAGYNYYTEEGHEVNDDSLHPFYAFDLHGVFTVWVDPETVEGYEWRSYTEEDPERNGTWCARFESTIVECKAGFDKYSNEVEL